MLVVTPSRSVMALCTVKDVQSSKSGICGVTPAITVPLTCNSWAGVPECAAKLGIVAPSPPRFSRRDGGDCEGQTDLLTEDAVTRVWMTEAGDRYHASRDCLGLQAGQQGGEAQGYKLREIVEMDLNAASAAGKTACGTCGGTTVTLKR
ncbi:hypothetical protein [Nonomuraea sp. NPDC049695]|uniref:hypothetical protein n=1 Tax=Nonomuraea sp. NPDC049695 TaxID=3154734 RepID=UPI0034203479